MCLSLFWVLSLVELVGGFTVNHPPAGVFLGQRLHHSTIHRGNGRQPFLALRENSFVAYNTRSTMSMSTSSDEEENEYDTPPVDRLTREIDEAVEAFNAWSMAKKSQGFQDICESMITGDFDTVPEPMQCLLMVRTGRYDQYIYWVPFILHRILEGMQLESGTWLDEARLSMIDLFVRLVDPFGRQDKGTEILLAIILVARGIANFPSREYREFNGELDQYLLHIPWREDKYTVPLTVRLNPFNDTNAGGMGFESAVLSWAAFEPGLELNETNGPTYDIFLPTLFRLFGAYDIVTMYSENGAVIDCRGYYLTTMAESSVRRSMWTRMVGPLPASQTLTRSLLSRARTGHRKR